MSSPRFTHPTKELSREQHAMVYYECWSCGQPANSHCGPAEPREGEVLVCLNCAAPAVFDARGAPKEPMPIVHAGIAADPEYRSFAAAIRAATQQALLAHKPDPDG
jgi:hypothetical protein